MTLISLLSSIILSGWEVRAKNEIALSCICVCGYYNKEKSVSSVKISFEFLEQLLLKNIFPILQTMCTLPPYS